VKRVFGLLLAAVLVLTLLPTVSAFGDGTAEDSAPGWQAEVTFPDWKGYTDDTRQRNTFSAASLQSAGIGRLRRGFSVFLNPDEKAMVFLLILWYSVFVHFQIHGGN